MTKPLKIFSFLDLGGGDIQVAYTLEMSAFLYCMLLSPIRKQIPDFPISIQIWDVIQFSHASQDLSGRLNVRGFRDYALDFPLGSVHSSFLAV